MIRSFGDFELDLDRFELRRDGSVIHVEPQVFDVLAYLTHHAERVVTKEELLDEIWGSRFVSESTLTSRVKAARRAIGDHGSIQAVIRTVRGRGFRFVVPVTTSDGPPSGSITDQRADAPTTVLPGERGLPPPADLGPLIGRGREVAALDRQLAEARLVTIVGPGGVGKTRLAQHVAARVSATLGLGLVFVDLSPVTEPAEVVRALTESVGVHFGSVDDPLTAVAEQLRSAPHLLLLDNFEQVAAAAPLVGTVLGHVPELRILVTSRERLRLQAERIFTLEPLDCVAHGEHRAPAVELFELAARRIEPAYTVDDQDVADVAAVCRKVDGLPLAVELVASYAPVLSPAQLATRLDSLLDVATADLRDVAERHRTMRDTVAWSFRLLTPDEQRLLCRMAVFREAPSVEAVDQICASGLGADIATALRSLLDKSLLRRRVDGGDARFSMPGPIQAFALAQLEESGDGPAIRDRYAQLHHDFVGEVEEERWTRRSGSWCQDLSARMVDIESAIAFDFAAGEPDRAASTVANLYARRLRVGGLAAAARWTAMAFDRVEHLGPLDVGRLHLGAGYVDFLEHRLDDARGHFERARELFDGAGHDRYRALAMADVAGTSMGNLAACGDALQLCRHAVTLARSVGEAPLLAHNLNVIGELLRHAGDAAAARAAYEEALALAFETGDEGQQLVLELDLAAVALRGGEPADALDLCRKALRQAVDLNASELAASALGMLSGPTALLGQPELGACLLGAADAAIDNLGYARGPGDTPEYDRVRAVLTERLGADRAQAQMAVGRKMSLHEAIDRALADA